MALAAVNNVGVDVKMLLYDAMPGLYFSAPRIGGVLRTLP
jgi:hypothetical protein